MEAEIVKMLTIVERNRLKLLDKAIYDLKNYERFVELAVWASRFCKAQFLVSTCQPFNFKVLETFSIKVILEREKPNVFVPYQLKLMKITNKMRISPY